MNAKQSMSREPSPVSRKRGLLSLGARRLAAVAGAPAGWATRQTRRGSFLVLVVGTLALMSVFAIVYIAIGRSDTGLSIGVKRNAVRDDVPKQFAEYVAGVIGADVLAVTAESDPSGQIALRREASDYPGSVWEMRSDITQPDRIFDPVGTYRTPWQGGGMDPRGPSDPWLAASEPTWLHFDGTVPPEDANVPFLDYRDWAHISNVAPDGRFVNLSRLRNNFSASAANLYVTAADMPLFDPATGDESNSTDFGLALTNNLLIQPAYLTARQARAFRSVNDNTGDPDDAFYTPYLWADADGDGMYDSRWFEMIDSRDPNNIRSMIDASAKYRFFFATRIIDLSGMVNVTTALDFTQAPTNADRSGKTPGDVDLRRLMSLEDVFNAIPPVPPNGEGGYQLLKQPPGSDTGLNARADNYSNYNGVLAAGVGSWAFHALYNDSVGAPPLGAMRTGIVPPVPFPNVPTNGAPFTFNADGRATMYEELGGMGGGSSFNAGVYDLSTLLGEDSIAELFAFRGINDPGYTSPLEAILGGRYIAPGQIPTTRRYSPMRENRGFDLDRSRPANATPEQTQEIMAWSFSDVRQRITTLSGARPLKSSIIAKIAPNAAVTAAENALSTNELKEKLTGDEQKLFEAYCDALVPDSAIDNAWPNGSPQFDQIRFQHYGYTSPEVGVVMAAHMAANMKDALDTDTTTTPFTVLLDEAQRSGGALNLNQDYSDRTAETPIDIGSRANQWAWWVDANGKLDLGDNNPNTESTSRSTSRLGDSNSGPSDLFERTALNVYGVEPQPVLTAVSSYYMYVDADESAGGDPDYADDDNMDGDPDSGDATIDGSADATNTDYLMQAVAFQITNPFDQAINLTNGAGAATPDVNFLYYVEFNGRFFRLASYDPANPGTLVEATLAPGQTRVFYVLCAAPDFIQSRWINHDSNISLGYDKVMSWASTQFRPSTGTNFGDPVLIEEFDPTNGQRTAYSTTMTDLIGVPGTAANPTIRQVRLWKAMRVIAASGVDERLPNQQYRENDLLVDRLKDPASDTLKAKLPDGDTVISGTEAPTNAHDGLAITTWGLINRSGEAGGNVQQGAFPAYMIESGRWNAVRTSNDDEQGPAGINLSSPAYSDFSGGVAGHDSFMSLIDFQSTAANPSVIAEMTRDPASFNSLGSNLNGTAFAALRAELTEGIDTDKMRVGDLLLPIAVGAEYAPVAGFWSPEEYLTLGESLALAFNYDSPAVGTRIYDNAAVATALYNGFGDSTVNLANPGGSKVERAGLVLDRFVPFNDVGGTVGVYDPGVDQVKGLGIPLALTILDQFHGLENFEASLTRPFFGQVNISTASLPVLRCLPMLSPTTGVTAGAPDWWWPAGGNLGVQTDIAATLAAYRDKIEVTFRQGTTSTLGPTNSAFLDTLGVMPDVTASLDGRYQAGGVVGVRERPGFVSVGEVMLARAVIPGNPTTYTDVANIDYLGFNNAQDSLIGVDSTSHNNVINAMSDEYGERLSIANGVLNSVTVRSDYFACWFLVHGYQKSDTVKDGGQVLGPSDPLVPSIQRRFLMIVDRSQVVKKGDKPRIVLFKEVPL